MSKSPDWTAALPPGWDVRVARRLFRERRQSSLADDVHLTPSQHHGVLPQAEYMQRTGSRVVLNLTGADNMKHVEPDDFVIHLRSFQGGIEHSPYRGKVSNAYTVFAASCEIEPRYYKWVLKSQPVIEQLASTTDQLRDGQSIKFEQFASLMLPVPPLEGQRRVANYLDDQTTRIDQAIQLRQQQVALVKEWAASKLAAGVDQLAEGHGWVPLRRHVSSIEQGWSPDCEAVQSADDEWGVVKVGAVYGGEFRPYENKRLPGGVEVRRRYEIRSGDLLVTRANTPERVGEACVVPARVRPKLLLCDKIYRLRTSENVFPDFVAAIARSHQARAYMSSLSSGTSGSMVNIRGDDVLGLQVPGCSTEHQAAFVDATRVRDAQVSNLLTTLQESIGVLSELRRSVITHIVSGESQVEQ